MDRKILTKTEVKSLEYIEKQLGTAMRFDYAQCITKNDIDLCADLVDKYIGKIGRNYSCNRCKLDILKKIAPIYFDSKKYYEEKKPKKGGKNEQV